MADDTNPQSDNQLRDWALETGEEKLADGRNQLDAAKQKFLDHGDTEEIEAETRSVLVVLRSAMDWLEDTDRFDEAHAELDAAGSYTRQTFGCWLHREGTSYEQRCPVALAHNRIGLSPAFLIEASECTICGQDPATCLHVAGRVYEGERCARRITKGKILEVSLVGRPAQPDARILAMSLPTSDLIEALGPDFEPGMDVSCHRSLKPCEGLSRPWG